MNMSMIKLRSLNVLGLLLFFSPSVQAMTFDEIIAIDATKLGNGVRVIIDSIKRNLSRRSDGKTQTYTNLQMSQLHLKLAELYEISGDRLNAVKNYHKSYQAAPADKIEKTLLYSHLVKMNWSSSEIADLFIHFSSKSGINAKDLLKKTIEFLKNSELKADPKNREALYNAEIDGLLNIIKYYEEDQKRSQIVRAASEVFTKRLENAIINESENSDKISRYSLENLKFRLGFSRSRDSHKPSIQSVKEFDKAVDAIDQGLLTKPYEAALHAEIASDYLLSSASGISDEERKVRLSELLKKLESSSQSLRADFLTQFSSTHSASEKLVRQLDYHSMINSNEDLQTKIRAYLNQGELPPSNHFTERSFGLSTCHYRSEQYKDPLDERIWVEPNRALKEINDLLHAISLSMMINESKSPFNQEQMSLLLLRSSLIQKTLGNDQSSRDLAKQALSFAGSQAALENFVGKFKAEEQLKIRHLLQDFLPQSSPSSSSSPDLTREFSEVTRSSPHNNTDDLAFGRSKRRRSEESESPRIKKTKLTGSAESLQLDAKLDALTKNIAFRQSLIAKSEEAYKTHYDLCEQRKGKIAREHEKRCTELAQSMEQQIEAAKKALFEEHEKLHRDRLTSMLSKEKAFQARKLLALEEKCLSSSPDIFKSTLDECKTHFENLKQNLRQQFEAEKAKIEEERSHLASNLKASKESVDLAETYTQLVSSDLQGFCEKTTSVSELKKATTQLEAILSAFSKE